MKYAVYLSMNRGTPYQEWHFDTEREARGKFNELFSLPARDHTWEWLQLLEYGAEGARGFIEEKRGL